ncbi:Retrovirus-related Pol polyprotein from transposon RE1 [Vitis vinifera]|uniref:Retrovirus-related Pol polyprotein from transposon RE1 n=1 Tax=Vitis vinifera TaxID=29760 RepID=A0A438I6Q5_VITVI|nr:Retrovirus-related Pol polyprotein from transposon RE1 [Vitis vinifera]
MHAPCEEQMESVCKILKHLKGSPGKGLYFRKNETRSIEGFIDAYWADSIDDRKSTSGYCTFVWGNFVTWRSKKQKVVARSSVEAEFRLLLVVEWTLDVVKDLRDLERDFKFRLEGFPVEDLE